MTNYLPKMGQDVTYARTLNGHNSVIFHPSLTFEHTKMISSSRQNSESISISGISFCNPLKKNREKILIIAGVISLWKNANWDIADFDVRTHQNDQLIETNRMVLITKLYLLSLRIVFFGYYFLQGINGRMDQKPLQKCWYMSWPSPPTHSSLAQTLVFKIFKAKAISTTYCV